MAIELTPALASPSFDPVFFILSIPVVISLLALLWAVLRNRLAARKNRASAPADPSLATSSEVGAWAPRPATPPTSTSPPPSDLSHRPPPKLL